MSKVEKRESEKVSLAVPGLRAFRAYAKNLGEKVTEAIAQRVLKSLGGARGLEATITDRLAGIAAEHSAITAEDIAEALGFTEHDIAQEVCLHSLAENLHMEDIARALQDYIDHEVIAENIDISDVASNLDFDSLATRIDAEAIAEYLQVPEVRVEYRKIVEGLLKALLSGEGLPKQGEVIQSHHLTVERTEEAS
tara:strand:- start:339 stop:923 length:585 start_codon:yes stop_codon:yes gene_type:complete